MGKEFIIKELASGEVSFVFMCYEFLRIRTEDGDKDNREKMRVAKAIRNEREHDLMYSTYDQLNPRKKKMSFIKYFEDVLQTEKKSKGYFSVLQKLKTFLSNKDITFEKIDKKLLDSFAEYLSNGANLKPNTA